MSKLKLWTPNLKWYFSQNQKVLSAWNIQPLQIWKAAAENCSFLLHREERLRQWWFTVIIIDSIISKVSKRPQTCILKLLQCKQLLHLPPFFYSSLSYFLCKQKPDSRQQGIAVLFMSLYLHYECDSRPLNLYSAMPQCREVHRAVLLMCNFPVKQHVEFSLWNLGLWFD